MNAAGKRTGDGSLKRVAKYQTRSNERARTQTVRQPNFEVPDSPQGVKPNTPKKRGRPSAKRKHEAPEEGSPAVKKRSAGRPRKSSRKSADNQDHVAPVAEARPSTDGGRKSRSATKHRRTDRARDDSGEEDGDDKDEERRGGGGGGGQRGDAEAEAEAEAEEATFGAWEDDTTEQLPTKDLLGYAHYWNTVVKAHKDLGKIVQEHQIELKTRKAYQLCEKIDLLIGWYRDAPDSSTPKLAQQKHKEFKRDFDSLSESVEALNFSKGEPDRIRTLLLDTYTSIVPLLVIMIDLAIKTHALSWENDPDLTQLGEIIAHLKLLVSLSQAISTQTDLKPHTTAPIVKPVKNKIFPPCRDLEQCLSKELKRLKREQAYSQEELNRQREEWNKSQEAARLSHMEKIMQRRQEIAQTVARMKAEKAPSVFDLPPRDAFVEEPPAEERSTKPSTLEWTEEETKELIKQLAYHSELPNDQRYDRCVHCRLLQNKSVELVREQALKFKPALEALYTEMKGMEVPDWVASID